MTRPHPLVLELHRISSALSKVADGAAVEHLVPIDWYSDEPFVALLSKDGGLSVYWSDVLVAKAEVDLPDGRVTGFSYAPGWEDVHDWDQEENNAIQEEIQDRIKQLAREGNLLPPTNQPGDTLQYVRGNLVTSDCDIIAHGCNCYHNMMGGVAAAIARAYPAAVRADLATPYGDPKKLGEYSYARGTPTIFNLYTQFEPGGGKDGRPAVDYNAVRSCFTKLYHHLKSHDMLHLKVGIPKIGVGIAGGSWGKIEGIIRSAWRDGQIWVYVI